ncbi:LytR C-terminal domain-containing protein [Saccharomonospora sp. NPDC006951]
MSIFDGLSRPMRAAGLGLLAVAVVAAVIGGVTLVGNGSPSDERAEPTASQTSTSGTDGRQGSPSESQGAPPEPSESSQPSAPSSAPASPSPSGEPSRPPQGEPGEDKPASVKSVAVRVYNNSTIKGLAHDAAGDFTAQGWNVVETANYSAGVIPTTTVYFRQGTDEERAARELADQFGMRVEPRFEGIAKSSPGLIVIVTKDFEGTNRGK